jgi:hypothetical protein
MKAQTREDHCVTKPERSLKVRTGYKKYCDYSKIYCLDSPKSLLAVQALDKHRIRFTMPQYNYSEIMLLSHETALDNADKGGGKVLLEEIELKMNNGILATAPVAAVLALCTLTPIAFAHISSQQRYNDADSTGQNFAACKCKCSKAQSVADAYHWYVLELGHDGFAHQSKEFSMGYVRRFCSVSPKSSSDDDSASWDCNKGPSSASWVSG